MKSNRVHVTGASGSGVTTLGRALASACAIPHHETDDFFWLPTEPPYTEKRPISDRIRLMREMFLPRTGWVLSGSLVEWAREIEPHFDTIIFVLTPTEIRLARIQEREERRYGLGSTIEGGSHYASSQAFFDWAAGYDDPDFKRRSRVQHEEWLTTLRCPIIRVDGTRPLDELVSSITPQLT